MESLDFIGSNLREVLQDIDEAFRNSTCPTKKQPCLVAVSKIQPKEYIIEAYKHGQRHFGENYIQELYDKANDPDIIAQCPEIKWHLIGHIQSNKINKILACPNLSVIETIDSIKLAEALNSHISRKDKNNGKIDVFVQVNTSNEDAKSGIDFENVCDLITFITNKCDHLNFIGLMTIGAYGYDTSLGPNPDFVKLIQVRDSVCQKLSIDKYSLEISMGMSTDYEHAIFLGSTVVRVGTKIFGQRKPKD